MLEAETQALKQRDTDALQTLATQKRELTARLDALPNRETLLTSGTDTTLRERIERAKQINLINGTMIASSTRFIHRTVDFLTGRAEAPQLYGASGQLQSTSPNRYLSKA